MPLNYLRACIYEACGNHMCKVSIVIPCYNQGKFIDDALNSVEKINDKSLYEVIIVNDGSTDTFTNQRLKELSDTGYQVIFQENKGLAMARNVAVAASKGQYILPLDSDNMIRAEYVYKAIQVLDTDPAISIVYGDAQQFGDEGGIMLQGPYNMQRLMISNYIDACAVYRRAVWEANNGYDSKMPYTGIEDWDMWLNASFKGLGFHYIDEVLFDYRVLSTSMIRNLKASKKKGDANLEYLIRKYPQHFGPQFITQDIMSKLNESVPGFIGKLIMKKYFPALFNKKVEDGSLRKYI